MLDDALSGLGSPPGLVIFDCDGVLVDSEPVSMAVMLEVLAEAGCYVDPSVAYANMLGRSLKTIGDWLRRDYAFDLSQAHLQTIHERLFERFAEVLQPIPGVCTAVGALSIPVCVASSSQPDRIRLSLSLTGLLKLFEPRIFSATMVSRGKPAPDLFLHAATQMGVPAGECVVIEDSPAGILAAKAAGMRVVAFVGGSHVAPAGLLETVANLEPDAIILRMEELPALLRQSA